MKSSLIFMFVIALSVSYAHGFSLIPSLPSLPSFLPSFKIPSIGDLIGGGTLFGSFGDFFADYWEKIKSCVNDSKIQYTCIIPNIRFFIYTQLTGFPIPYIGPTLSTVNMAYLGVNYAPYLIADIVCVVKNVIFGGIMPKLPIPSLRLPGLPSWMNSLPIPKLPFLIYLNQTLGDQVYLNNTMLVENYDNYNILF